MIRLPDRIARRLGILDPRDTRPRKCRPRVVLTPTRVVFLRGRRVVDERPLPTELLGAALGAVCGWGWP